MKRYTSGCFQCAWNGEFDTDAERRTANWAHNTETGHAMIGLGTVPDELLQRMNEEENRG